MGKALADVRDTGKEDRLVSITHGAVSVVFAFGTCQSTGENRGREPQLFPTCNLPFPSDLEMVDWRASGFDRTCEFPNARREDDLLRTAKSVSLLIGGKTRLGNSERRALR